MEKKNVGSHVKLLLFCMVLVLVLVVGVFAAEKDISPELQQKIIDARTTPDLADDGESQSDYALRVLDDQLNDPEFKHNLVDSLVGDENKDVFKEFLGLGRTEDLWGFEIAGLDNTNGDLSIDENGVISLDGGPIIDTETTGVTKYTFRSEDTNYPGYLTAELEDGSFVHVKPGSVITQDESGNTIVTTDNDFGITSTAKIEGKGQFLFNDDGGDPQIWSAAGEQASVTVTETDSLGETISEYTIATDAQGPKTSNGLLYASAELVEGNNLKASGLVGVGSGEDASYYLVKSPKGAVFATGGEALTEGAVAVDRPSVRVGDDGILRTDLEQRGTTFTLQQIEGKMLVGENFILQEQADGTYIVKITGEGDVSSGATNVRFDENGNPVYGFENIDTFVNRQLAARTDDGRISSGGNGGQELASAETAKGGVTIQENDGGCEGGACVVDRLKSYGDANDIGRDETPGSGDDLQKKMGNFLGNRKQSSQAISNPSTNFRGFGDGDDFVENYQNRFSGTVSLSKKNPEQTYIVAALKPGGGCPGCNRLISAAQSSKAQVYSVDYFATSGNKVFYPQYAIIKNGNIVSINKGYNGVN